MFAWLRHSITFALIAMVSAASPAQTSEKLYQWYEVHDRTAPTASFLMENGKRGSLAYFKGQVVLLNLWATWCTPCLKELPTLDILEEEKAADGLVVLALSTDKLPFAQLRRFLDKQEIELPHLAQDTSGDVYEALGTRGLPLTYLIDRNGVLRARYSGATNWLQKDARQRVDQLLAEDEAR